MPFTMPSIKSPRWLRRLAFRRFRDAPQDSTSQDDLSSLRENVFLDRKQKERLLLNQIRTMLVLFDIESKIALMEKELTELRKQRDPVQKTMDIYDALFAPVRKLPPEILAEIFQLCVPIGPNHITPFDSRDAPLLLTHVCHRWRQVAQGTPQLWNRLLLYGRTPEIFFSSIWLNNLGSLPLEISVEIYRGQTPPVKTLKFPDGENIRHGWRMDVHLVWTWSEGAINQSSQIVIEQLSRIRRLSLVCAADGLRGYFPTETTATIPCLQELHVYYTHPGGLDIDPTEYSGYSILTPQLQTLFLDGGAEFLLPVLKGMSNLRRLDVRGNCTLDMLLDFVGMCPALQRISAFQIEVKHPREPMDTSHIILPGLSELGLGFSYPLDDGLEVGSEDWTHRTIALERLRTPNLQRAVAWCLPYLLRILSNCMADSQSELKWLTIRDMELNEILLGAATSILATIETMEFFQCTSSAGFWGSFIRAEYIPSNMWTLPKLKRLSLERVQFTRGHEEDFLQFVTRQAPPRRSQVQSAIEGICYLEEIVLIECPFSIGTFSALERLREDREGLSITMKECLHPRRNSEVDVVV